MADRFSADPTVVFMTAVLDDIANGKLLIPRFQRPLVWKWEQRRDLLSSIYEGLPVGALLLWISDGDPIGVYESLGPHALPPAMKGSENRYLMDGVQRVSTLYGALRANKSWEEYDTVAGAAVQDFIVYADLDALRDQDRFLRRVDIKEVDFKSDSSRFMPLNIMLDSREFLRFQRNIPPEHEARIDVADSVAAAFREYKIPLIALKSASLEVVTKSFQRVNSRGADMSELHMLNALSYSAEFDLLQHDKDLREELLAPLGWAHIDQEVVLRCIKLRFNADIYTTNPDDLSEQLKKNPNAIDEVFAALAQCASFLGDRLNLYRPEVVPYRMQIVGLAGVLFGRQWKALEQQLIDWFWISTYTEAFGSSARQSENALADLIGYAETGLFKWSLRESPSVRPLTNLRVDFRAARVKALALALENRRLECADENSIALVRFGFHLVPTEIQHFKNALVEGSLTSKELSGHLISDTAAAAAAAGQWSQFVAMREADIFAYEKDKIIAPAAKRLGLSISNFDAGKDVGTDGEPTVGDLFAEY
ncbi:MAG: DUF262 domain-containing protein [bacterium]|nr:DUF262 domain-containing protein [bacterium]